MTKKTNGNPPYPKKAHKSGQARIKINRVDVYLGIFGSPESYQEYAKAIARASGEAATNAPPQNRNTIINLLSAFILWAEERYVKNGEATSEVASYRRAMAPVAELFGDDNIDSFGPRKLMSCREKMIAAGYCRTKINQYVGRIRRIWKWGVAREMVAASTWHALTAVEGLRRGQAKDRPKVTTVAADAIDAVKSKVLPPVRTMIDLQLATAMRPQEVCAMRTCDILSDSPLIPTSLQGLCWLYQPPTHKGEHHDKVRLIFLGPQAQELVRAWLRPEDPTAPLFSPAEAVNFYQSQRSAKASTHRRHFVRKKNPKRKPGNVYKPVAYGKAIAKACKLLDIPRWSPNRLRHNAATLIRQRYGVEVARVILGHANLKVTEVYAEVDLEKAAKAIAEFG